MALALAGRRARRRSAPVLPSWCTSMRFLVALREVDADLHCVMIPDLPGCRAVGRNAEQAILYARRAIDEHCRMLAREGEPMPEAQPLEHHVPLPDLFAEATWTSVDVPIEQYFTH
jgi:predicted RNase H-like HicB family nuclease